MTLVEKIKSIYSELTNDDFVDIIQVQNDSNGQGDYIAKWEHPTLAQPTQEQLDAISS
jgi:hypothetical protein